MGPKTVSLDLDVFYGSLTIPLNQIHSICLMINKLGYSRQFLLPIRAFHPFFGPHFRHIWKNPLVANGPQNGFTGPRSLLWLFDKALKPNSLSLFDEKPIGVQRPIFSSQIGPSTPWYGDLSPKCGIN